MTMLVINNNFVKHFQCNSSDERPDFEAAGSTLHIVDTGEMYVSHNGIWEEDLRLVYAIQRANL